VENCTDGHEADGHRVTGFDFKLTASGSANLVTCLEALGRDDVLQSVVWVANQRDVCIAVGVIFQSLDNTFNVKDRSLEIDDTVASLVTATSSSCCDSALVVATTIASLDDSKCTDGPRKNIVMGWRKIS